jgi:predicted ATPase
MHIYPRGSEWRKWDLHVHTPASVLRNEFGEDWDEYVVTLFKKAIENDIRAIGITDYYLPEGYKILKKEYLDNPKKLSSIFNAEEIEEIKKIKVFPNIEFRITKLVLGKEKDLSWNRKVNYHVIFSDDIDIEKIESDFISQIQVCFNASTGTTVEKRPLTKSNLEELGKRLIREHPPFSSSGSELFVGMLNASVDEDNLVSILNGNSNFKDKYLLGLPCDEDLSDVSWNSQGHNIRKNLIKQAHFIFSSNSKTKQFLLGGTDKELFKTEFGSIKPCLWGSDAHTKDELFKPAKNRNTWIKADVTFEGLKSVIYDPSTRVVIQELNPQQKRSYQTISRVRFVDQNQTQLFSDQWQVLNPDLNTIIGGKSSGKSLLLYHIAKSINSAEVDKKVRLSKSSSYSDLNGVDFEVEWSNGEISTMSDTIDTKPITYIPQLYINHLAEEDGKNQLNTLVKDILNQNDSFKEFSEAQERKILFANKELVSKIDALYELRNKYKALCENSEAFGTKPAVEGEIDKLKKYIAELREKSGFTESEETEYKKLAARKSSLENRINLFRKLVECNEQVISSSTLHSKTLLNTYIDSIVSDVDMPNDSTYLKSLLDSLHGDLQKVVTNFSDYVLSKGGLLPSKIFTINAEIDEINEKLKPLLKKITDKESLDLADKNLKLEEGKLRSIEEIDQKKVAVKKQGVECKDELKNQYDNLINHYKDYVIEIAKPDYLFEEDINISAEVAFDSDKFNEFVGAFDRRGNLQSLLGELVSSNGDFNYNIEQHSEKVSVVYENFNSKKEIPSVRKGIADIDVIKKLYSDCFYINFIVQYKNDDIVRMSPGKRGLVLLNLILHLSNSSHPILIDQPEDNLDNRTIYDQLNEFIRLKKVKRQIIMVTHNANLVVAADSECVIVANQSGQQANIDNEKFKFEYCSGSLECSFEDNNELGTLKNKGIRQHVCEILEGGVSAFKEREMKYGFTV